VLGIVSIFTYNMQKGFDKLKAAGLINHSLCDFDTLIEVAAETGYVDRSALPGLIEFRDTAGK